MSFNPVNVSFPSGPEVTVCASFELLSFVTLNSAPRITFPEVLTFVSFKDEVSNMLVSITVLFGSVKSILQFDALAPRSI